MLSRSRFFFNFNIIEDLRLFRLFTKSFGFVRYSSRVASSHAQSAPLSPLYRLKPLAVPAFRPIPPANDGPILCFPTLIEWQALHLLKTFLPRTASPPAMAGVAPRTCIAPKSSSKIFIFFIVNRPFSTVMNEYVCIKMVDHEVFFQFFIISAIEQGC